MRCHRPLRGWIAPAARPAHAVIRQDQHVFVGGIFSIAQVTKSTSVFPSAILTSPRSATISESTWFRSSSWVMK